MDGTEDLPLQVVDVRASVGGAGVAVHDVIAASAAGATGSSGAWTAFRRASIRAPRAAARLPWPCLRALGRTFGPPGCKPPDVERQRCDRGERRQMTETSRSSRSRQRHAWPADSGTCLARRRQPAAGRNGSAAVGLREQHRQQCQRARDLSCKRTAALCAIMLSPPRTLLCAAGLGQAG